MIDLSKFSILYGCKIEDCATGDMFTHEISLSKYALDESSCGCLEATLLHEFFHTTGTLPVLSPEDEGNERKASACELKCFPDCALVDKDISPEECCDLIRGGVERPRWGIELSRFRTRCIFPSR